MSSTLESSTSIPILECGRRIHPLCDAIVVIPAKDEERSLKATLNGLRLQKQLDGGRLRSERYEVLLLLNNCSDRSPSIAKKYAADHPDFNLHVLECSLPAEHAHVGTARRALMDTACCRLESLVEEGGQHSRRSIILSTDADTVVAPDWIAANLMEIDAGADAVGGVIHLFPEDLETLDSGTRLAYEQDRRLQSLTAQLESLLDPDPADPWPRHLEHFGASLACTPKIYRLCGGLPAVQPLEDIAFINELRKVGAKIRHSPRVHVFTSARLDGRAEVGLSWQLRQWRDEDAAGIPHNVDSALWLEHRFKTLSCLRRLNDSNADRDLRSFPLSWRTRIGDCLRARVPTPDFLDAVNSDSLIEQMFEELPGAKPRTDEITSVLSLLMARISHLNTALTGPA